MSDKQKPLLGELIDWGNPLSRGLTGGCWLINEMTGNKAYDLSGNGNTITAYGSPNWVAGKFGSAIDLDGQGSGQYLEWTPKQYSTGDFTIVMWIKVGEDVIQYLFSAGYNNDPSWMFYHQASEIYYIENDGGTTVYDDFDINYAIGEWQHLVFRRKGTTLDVFQDAVLTASDVVNACSGAVTGNYQIGWARPRDAADRECMCQLDNVLFYHRALADFEIAQLYDRPFCFAAVKRRRIGALAEEIAGVPPTTFPYYYREIASRRIA